MWEQIETKTPSHLYRQPKIVVKQTSLSFSPCKSTFLSNMDPMNANHSLHGSGFLSNMWHIRLPFSQRQFQVHSQSRSSSSMLRYIFFSNHQYSNPHHFIPSCQHIKMVPRLFVSQLPPQNFAMQPVPCYLLRTENKCYL